MLKPGCLKFVPVLAHNLDQADAVAESIKTMIDRFIDARGIDAPVEARYASSWRPAAEVSELDLAGSGIRSAIWSIGYRFDYRWIELPVFDGKGLSLASARGDRRRRTVLPGAALALYMMVGAVLWGGPGCGVPGGADSGADRVEGGRGDWVTGAHAQRVGGGVISRVSERRGARPRI